MSTYDERLTAVEQTIASLRHDFLQAIMENTRSMSTLNKVVLQQEQNTRDANHEITILTGVISAQGRDIKEMKNHLESFDQCFASLEGKLEQVVQLLTTPPRQSNNLPALKASMLFLTWSVSLKLQKAGR